MTGHDEFLVPYGLNADGHLVVAAHALPKVDYACPNPHCGRVVRLRRESSRARAYFFHLDGANCDPNLYTHDVAIRAVVQTVRDSRAERGAEPRIERQCAACGSVMTAEFLPLATCDAVPEYALPALHRRPDVALVDERGNPLLFVEVFHTHEVSPAKEGDYASCDLPWIEVEACAILRAPTTWTVRQPRRAVCDQCRTVRDAFARARSSSSSAYERERRARARAEERQQETMQRARQLGATFAARVVRIRDAEELVPASRPDDAPQPALTPSSARR